MASRMEAPAVLREVRSLLPVSVPPRAAPLLLVLRSGSTPRLLPPDLRASTSAVDISAIAAAADEEQTPAPAAKPLPQNDFLAARTPSRHFRDGQRAASRGMLPMLGCRRFFETRRCPKLNPGRSLRPGFLSPPDPTRETEHRAWRREMMMSSLPGYWSEKPTCRWPVTSRLCSCSANSGSAATRPHG